MGQDLNGVLDKAVHHTTRCSHTGNTEIYSDQALKNRRPGKGRVGERVECLARAAA